MMDWHVYGWGSSAGGYVLMVLGMLVFWGLVLAAVALVLRQPDRQDRAAGGTVPVHRTAEQVLAERFAGGEIDEAEFTSRLTTLHGQPQR